MGYRLSVDPMEIIHAKSGAECAMKCAAKNGCRSVNFKKPRSCEEMENCELLTKVDSETPPRRVTANKEYDYYRLLDCNGNELDPTTSSSATQQQSTTLSKMTEAKSSIPQPTMTSFTCSNADWWQSFDSKGLSKCGAENLFIAGFYRSPPYLFHDPILLLEEAKCCKAITAYSGQSSQCETANWLSSLGENDKWSKCPVGYFLNGLHREGGKKLSDINKGYCCKPANHPNKYGSCYTGCPKKKATT
ncbi:uncharacterized protein LOC114526052 [Dendronephthya gigantea]|uniref:uncharacterized protein LOC114526052 n=1 Tax=Dendronephthya gigantea TaxID=151771 RepID=UPI00106CD5BE|nr:uncharacterized protein LOC114526052 [Dendronephthya gigantea]